ncbi:RUS1 family protein C16orf58 [Amphibalanus amphitrite]|uniref:RUS1 family protein C16orf58 n=1 Tax=Amphibalanus amphitrite TaxID=1232801 RepID=A0A6A4WNM0_AMPAM|nr:RUS1 family protein C16orf58 [Amphibalanus amphitrite]
MPAIIEQHFGATHEATIELSPSGDGAEGQPRIISRHVQRRGLVDTLREIFLPQGYPESVSDDYLEYQVWDTLQAFASNITGALATRAVLGGMGVGDAEATPLAATITWLLKDGTGMVGQIVFAWRSSSGLDARCKQWRLFADVLNDAAICLELAAPALGTAVFKVAVIAAGLAKSLVGVAGGATRAAIAQHQALRSNMADLSVKDGSQERVVNLVGLLTTMALLPLVDAGSAASWLIFLLFTALHVLANYRAVRAVRLSSLNTPRLSLVFDGFLAAPGAAAELGVTAVNSREPLVLGTESPRCQSALTGWRLLLGAPPLLLAARAAPGQLDRLTALYAGRPYLLLLDPSSREALVCLRRGAGPAEQLGAALAAAVAVRLRQAAEDGGEVRLVGPVASALAGEGDAWRDDWQAASERVTKQLLPQLLERLRVEGWVVKDSLLEPGEYRGVW